MAASVRTLLCVDDEPDLLRVISGALRLRGRFQVLSATSGEQALDCARRFRADALLLDLMMPRLDGLATLALLRQLPGYAEVPAIFLTAQTESARITALVDPTISGVIVKPFETLRLGQTIEHLLSDPKRPTSNSGASWGTSFRDPG